MRHRGNRCAIFFAVSLGSLLLTACGELAYKRGGQASELAEVQSDCRNKPKPEQTYEQCMTSKGWTVQNLEQFPLIAATTVNEDNRAPSQPAIGTTAETAAAPVASSTDHIPATAASAATVPANQFAERVLNATPATTARPELTTDLLKINSMWKFGGTASQLQDETEKCIADLGQAHRPVTGQQQLMTRALVKCLREKGWFAAATK